MSSYLEAIAALGKGSLHPGGFTHTLSVLRRLSISPEDVVLDIGCGTGRTACYIAKTYGAHVFALDNSETMLAKGRSRAAREGAEVHFIHGDILDMPFADEVADLIVIESVLIFLPVRDALKECFRVLKKSGTLIDVEMLARHSLPPGAGGQIREVCGLPQLPALQEWIGYFEEAGFTRAAVRQSPFPGLLENLKELLHPDPHAIVSQEMITDGKTREIILQYAGLVLRYRRHLGFATFMVWKE